MKPGELDDLITHHTADVGGLKMHWVEAGAGPLVVLLHGFPEMWWSWRHQLRPLAEAGFRVVVPDQRGYAETEQKGPYDLDTLAADICRLIDHLGAGPTARIVGHDWGGAVAWHLAATRAEHVERVAVLNCPHPIIMRKAFLNPRQAMRSWYMFMFQIPGLGEQLLKSKNGGGVLRVLKAACARRDHTSDEELEPFRANIMRPGAATAMIAWYRAIPRQIFNPPKLDVITCDTLIVWGMKDTALGFDDLVPGTERWAPRLKVIRVEDSAHFVHAENPAEVNGALIDFLAM